ncbi:hypothetical protein [Desulfovibrio psychrotolerans]|uniref:hypothetical protein n=1 Tax=Desulfovibrio psychrotolerans TaxID=415242 RepID=UPI00157AD936|nr:hypothetical protein [Desulfovibrio psychrotolerans]
MLPKGCALHSPAGLSKVAGRFDTEEQITRHVLRVEITHLRPGCGKSAGLGEVAATTG